MKIVLSHPTGNEFVRNALRAFKDGGHLAEFHTTVATFENTLFDRLSRMRFGEQLKRRRYDQDLAPLTYSKPFKELVRCLAVKYGCDFLKNQTTGKFSTDKVYQQIDQFTAKRITDRSNADVTAVYCYENGAMHSFAAARKKGIHCIYELPIGYWRAAQRVLAEEAEILPEWAPTMRMLEDSPQKLEQKDIELQTSDTLIVASKFTADTLKEAPFEVHEPITIPYGCGTAPAENVPQNSSSDKLRVLYVGGLSQRKGVAYLIDAIRKVDKITDLTIVGRRVAKCEILDAALQEYRWIETLPHHKVLEQMRSHDVLVFPSLFEGFGLVLTEALSQGIPVITTEHTAGPDIITEGKEGFIVPIRDSEAIAQKLEWLHKNPDQLQEMKVAALNRAKEITWGNYRQSLDELAQNILSRQLNK